MIERAQRSVVCFFPQEPLEALEDFRQQYIANPGKNIPLHVTLLYNFYLPEEIDENIISALEATAKSTPKFEFMAKPLSSFPTSRVLYLTPSPASPLEGLAIKLYTAFPDFHNPQYGLPVFHMTIALGNPDHETDRIIDEYFHRFGQSPLRLKAGRLAVYAQYGDQWKEYLSTDIG